MGSSKKATLAWEERWSRPVGIATLGAVALLIASVIAIASLSSGGEAASLRSVNEHGSSVTLSGGLQAAAFILLIAPLVFLFRAASARAPKMRKQFLGLVIAAPIFLAAASLLNIASAHDAAKDFVAGKSSTNISVKDASSECASERKSDPSSFKSDNGVETSNGAPTQAIGKAGTASSEVANCAKTKREDDEAKNAITNASTRSISEAFRIGGGLGLAFALAYGCLYAMRVGLLSRFWGSLGIALGVAAALGLFQFSLIWFIYFGLLAFGWLPGGRPPAWAAGEAVPWPTPGERAAEALANPEIGDQPEASVDSLPELPEGSVDDDAPPPVGGNGERPRKRKRRGDGE